MMATKQPTTAPQQPVQITPEMLAATNYPKAAFYLSVFGGALMFFEGLAAIFFRSIYYGIEIDVWAGLSMVLIGIFLIINASVVSGAAISLLLKPDLRKAAGVSIILFSLLALFFGGGWIIGSVLGVIGGLMAIFWKPNAA